MVFMTCFPFAVKNTHTKWSNPNKKNLQFPPFFSFISVPSFSSCSLLRHHHLLLLILLQETWGGAVDVLAVAPGRKVGRDYFCWLVPSEACVACVCVCSGKGREWAIQAGQPAVGVEVGIWSLSYWASRYFSASVFLFCFMFSCSFTQTLLRLLRLVHTAEWSEWGYCTSLVRSCVHTPSRFSDSFNSLYWIWIHVFFLFFF